MPQVTTATREEYIGHALEAHIRSRISDRRWYRVHRQTHSDDDCRMVDLERETNRELRLLFAVRSDGRRQERAARAHVERAYRDLWAESVARGRYIVDTGDHFAYPESAA